MYMYILSDACTRSRERKKSSVRFWLLDIVNVCIRALCLKMKMIKWLCKKKHGY